MRRMSYGTHDVRVAIVGRYILTKVQTPWTD